MIDLAISNEPSVGSAITPHEMATLLASVAASVDVPSEAAVLLEGSHAEGFANSSSDVDFLLIHPGDQEYPLLRKILYPPGRRVEVRMLSAGQLAVQLRWIKASATSETGLDQLTEDDLDRCQRFLGGVVLANPDLADELRAVLPREELAYIVSRWWAMQARRSLWYAVGLNALSQHESAAGWARNGLQQAMKAYVARRGESYLKMKWLDHQLDRCSGPLAAEYRDLLDSAGRADGCGPAQFTTAALDLARHTGWSTVTDTPACLVLTRAENVAEFDSSGRMHLIRDRTDVFVLNDNAAQLWRNLRADQPLTETLAAHPDQAATVAEFLRLGFITLGHDAEAPLIPWQPECPPLAPLTPPPARTDITLTLSGAPIAPDDDITLSPLPAPRFARCGTELLWAVIFFAATREDMIGALAQQDWTAATAASTAMLTYLAREILTAHGIEPLPPDSDVMLTLRRLRCEHRTMFDSTARAAAGPISSADDGAHRLGLLDRLAADVGKVSGCDRVRTYLESSEAIERMDQVGRAWGQLNLTLGLGLRYEEAYGVLDDAGKESR